MSNKIVLEVVEFSIDPEEFGPRFWAKVQKSEGCWEWVGARNADNYGLIKVRQRNFRAHRVSYALATGKTPELPILHSCDNPPCVRPDHLREGTQTENMQDAIDRGRLHIVGGFHSKKTHCPQGHPYDEENTKVRSLKTGSTGRTCKECHRQHSRKFSLQKKRQEAS